MNNFIEQREKKRPISIWKPVVLASLIGFEPTAFRLGGGPSILLRYRDKL